MFNSTIYPHTNSNNTLYQFVTHLHIQSFGALLLDSQTHLPTRLPFSRYFSSKISHNEKNCQLSLRVRNHLSLGFCASVLLCFFQVKNFTRLPHLVRTLPASPACAPAAPGCCPPSPAQSYCRNTTFQPRRLTISGPQETACPQKSTHHVLT